MTKNIYRPLTIVADCVDAALGFGLQHLLKNGIVQDSRNGRVLRYPAPVTTMYTNPRNRVLFSPTRDANPFFHFFEGLWMLAGCNDSASVAHYAKQMSAFADEDGTLWGAYGWRWREFFGFDQLEELIQLMRRDPLTRRAVLAMWSPKGDLIPTLEHGHEAKVDSVWGAKGGIHSKDVPCNTQVYFDPSMGRLDMTVCNRSNDAVWGAYGANVVHMSMLHEFMSLATGIPLGHYYQQSNNFHIYLDRPDVQRLVDTTGARVDWCTKLTVEYRYPTEGFQPGGLGELRPKEKLLPVSMSQDWAPAEGEHFDYLRWGSSAFKLVYEPQASLSVDDDEWFHVVAQPILQAHAAYKAGNWGAAIGHAQRIAAPDWALACESWVWRRKAAADAATTKGD